MGIQVKYTMMSGETATLSENEGFKFGEYFFETREEAETALRERYSWDSHNYPTVQEILERTNRQGDKIEFIEV